MRDLERLKASAQRALRGQVPVTLCAYSFAIDSERKLILLKAHFSAVPSESDMDDISTIETEIMADFIDTFETKTEVEIIDPGQQPKFLCGGIAYFTGI